MITAPASAGYDTVPFYHVAAAAVVGFVAVLTLPETTRTVLK